MQLLLYPTTSDRFGSHFERLLRRRSFDCRTNSETENWHNCYLTEFQRRKYLVRSPVSIIYCSRSLIFQKLSKEGNSQWPSRLSLIGPKRERNQRQESLCVFHQSQQSCKTQYHNKFRLKNLRLIIVSYRYFECRKVWRAATFSFNKGPIVINVRRVFVLRFFSL